jgi:hypothetical protein
MFSDTYLHSTAPLASQVASHNDSGGSSSLIIIVLIAIGAVWLLTALGSGSDHTVVVVQKSPGAFLGWTVIAAAVLILFFVYIRPGSGPA